jgi:membrane associated rhomboid family serine protease
MANRNRYSSYSNSGFPSSFFLRGVKWLLIANIAVFVLYVIATMTGLDALFRPFVLVPRDVMHLAVWQVFTYLFLHSPHDPMHILFNMLFLWMFGGELEGVWGTRRFMKYYFLCGVGAGICVVVANLLFGNPASRTIGASGAIYGLILAYGVLFPDRIILFMWIFPMKVKYFAMIMGGIAFFYTVVGTGGGVSHVAHLGGMIFGFFYLRSESRRGSLWGAATRWWQDYKLQRAKRKFQVYLRKRDSSNRDRWVN